jgi:hypothetical protein
MVIPTRGVRTGGAWNMLFRLHFFMIAIIFPSENTKNAHSPVTKCPLPSWKMLFRLHFVWLQSPPHPVANISGNIFQVPFSSKVPLEPPPPESFDASYAPDSNYRQNFDLGKKNKIHHHN